MKFNFEASLFHHCLQNLLSPFAGAAIVDEKGRALLIHSSDLVDLGTFPTAAQLSDQYLKLKHEDIVLLNDPYSGGSHLASMTLVMGVQSVVSGSKLKKMFLCVRVPFRPTLGEGSNLDQEGIRIPPAPLYSRGAINTDLVNALSGHPLCPADFETFIQNAIQKMLDQTHKFKNQLESLNLKLDHEFIENFHTLSQQRAAEALDDFAIGEAGTEVQLDGGKTKLSLHLNSSEKGISFDFAGTTGSNYLNLTDAATLGACFGALYSLTQQPVPMNYGSMQGLNVSTPQDSFVNVGTSKPLYMGMNDGVGLVASQVLKLMGTIDPRKQLAQSGLAACFIELVFADDSRYFDHIEMGLAASEDKDGQPGLNAWKRSHLSPSIESAETMFPIKVHSHSLRQKSGGSGRNQGGDGITRKVETLQPAILNWRLFDEFKKNDGIAGGKTGKGPELSVETKPGTISQLTKAGSLQIPAGSIIIMNSSGGGGAGIIDEESDD